MAARAESTRYKKLRRLQHRLHHELDRDRITLRGIQPGKQRTEGLGLVGHERPPEGTLAEGGDEVRATLGVLGGAGPGARRERGQVLRGGALGDALRGVHELLDQERVGDVDFGVVVVAGDLALGGEALRRL